MTADDVQFLRDGVRVGVVLLSALLGAFFFFVAVRSARE